MANSRDTRKGLGSAIWHVGDQTKLKPLSRTDILSRPLSKLARNRVHELSDIREASLSSKPTTCNEKTSPLTDGTVDESDAYSPGIDGNKLDTTSSNHVIPTDQFLEPRHQRRVSRAVSTISLPLQEIPERRSSMSMLSQNVAGSQHASVQDLPTWKTPPGLSRARTVMVEGRADSPVRNVLARGAQSSEALRSSPSRTFVRTAPSSDILDAGAARHPRLDMSVRLPSPLFVGGGTIEGQIELKVDSASTKKIKVVPLLISKLSVDVLGVEETSDGNRHTFLSLAAELLDESHPPPPAMVTSPVVLKGSELFWETRPAQVVIPFCINLPLNLGPPPYISKNASIRYLLCPTASFKVGEKYALVRQICNIQMLTIHDPEKALGSLPTPLLATDTLTLSQSPLHTVKLTAGLHRQTWVNGGLIFVDIHVVNSTPKPFKKIELRLEKTTLWYSHAAAGTADKSASHLRLPKRSETDVVSSTTIKKGKEWCGIQAQSSEVRTCELEVPRGHVTITSGRYFEVRYFVGVSITINMFRTLAVQLPITVIHINSLDILPNSLAQVAASIEAKRLKTRLTQSDNIVDRQYRQGQAFNAARRQSLDRISNVKEDLAHGDVIPLTRDVDNSPRRRLRGFRYDVSQTSVCDSEGPDECRRTTRNSVASHHHHRRHPSCYHCHLAHNVCRRPQTSEAYTGPRLPRLQVSTSGLGFSESEFEVPADSPPRKVMLSELERKMIHQQRELNLQRQRSMRDTHKETVIGRGNIKEVTAGLAGWKNVAAIPNAQLNQLENGSRNQIPMGRAHSRRANSVIPRTSALNSRPRRIRSKTNPEGLRTSFIDSTTDIPKAIRTDRARDEVTSMDRGRHVPKTLDDVHDGSVFGHPKVTNKRHHPQTKDIAGSIRHI